MWFYSLPIHDALCHPAEKLYGDYLGAVKFGNIFSLDAGPDYAGRLREIDVQTLGKVGQMIRDHAPDPSMPPPQALSPPPQLVPAKIETTPIKAFCVGLIRSDHEFPRTSQGGV